LFSRFHSCYYSGPIGFFRSRLTRLKNEEIEEYLVGLDQHVKRFKQQLFRISWYMRGGVSINDLMDRYSVEDIEIMTEIITDNIETTKAAHMPLL